MSERGSGYRIQTLPNDGKYKETEEEYLSGYKTLTKYSINIQTYNRICCSFLNMYKDLEQELNV